MTPEDVVDVLSKCSAFDQRTVGEVDVIAWHEILGRVDREDALAAVARHYADSRDRAMPADILKLSRVARDERKRIEGKSEPLALPSRFEPDPDRVRRIAEGIAAARAILPAEDEAEARHRKAVARARRENGRPSVLPRKQKKAPKAPKHADPVSDDIAAMARHYLITGYSPDEVEVKLGVSRRWCEREARRFKPKEEQS